MDETPPRSPKKEHPEEQPRPHLTTLHAQVHPATDVATSSSGMTFTLEQIRDTIQSLVDASRSDRAFYLIFSSMLMSSISPSWFIYFGASNHMTSVE